MSMNRNPSVAEMFWLTSAAGPVVRTRGRKALWSWDGWRCGRRARPLRPTSAGVRSVGDQQPCLQRVSSARRRYRTLARQAETAAVLSLSRAQQAEPKATIGAFCNDTSLVSNLDDGHIMSRKIAAKQVDLAWVATGLPRRTPHELSHTFTTLAVQYGVPLKLVADRLDHAHSDWLADIFAHMTEKGNLQLAEAPRDVLNSPIPTSEPTSSQKARRGLQNPPAMPPSSP